MKKLLFILLLPTLAFAQPPPIQTDPLSVNGSTHTVYPTDETSGIVTDAMSALSVKPWCRQVATTNQALSGIGTIDGFATAVGDLVLLTAQTAGSENGPWIASSGAWTRPAWYASGHTTQAFLNIGIQARIGTQKAGTWWRITTAGAITIDTTATTWAQTANLSLTGGVSGTLQAAQFPALTGVVTSSAGSLTTALGTSAASSANLAALLTNETGTNLAVFNTDPTIVRPSFVDGPGPGTVQIGNFALGGSWVTFTGDGTAAGSFIQARIDQGTIFSAKQGFIDFRFANGVTKSPFLRALASGGTYMGNIDNYADPGLNNLTLFNGSLSVGIITAAAKIHAVSTTEQLRLGFNTTNYVSETVNSAGVVTLDAVGTAPEFRFNDSIGIANIPSGSPTPAPVAGYGKLYIYDGALKYVSPTDGPGGVSHVTTLATQ